MDQVLFKQIEAEKTRLRSTEEYKTAYDQAAKKMHRILDNEAIEVICKHPAQLHEYWQDPSGNNGSGWCCGVCGKDIR